MNEEFFTDAFWVLIFLACWLAVLCLADVGGRVFWRWWRRRHAPTNHYVGHVPRRPGATPAPPPRRAQR